MYTFYYLSLPTLLLSFLQVYLCRRNLRWGRILPIVSAVLGVGGGAGGGAIADRPQLTWDPGPRVLSSCWPWPPWCMFNIPTLVYFLIYRYQKRRREREDLDRMKIDDLE